MAIRRSIPPPPLNTHTHSNSLLYLSVSLALPYGWVCSVSEEEKGSDRRTHARNLSVTATYYRAHKNRRIKRRERRERSTNNSGGLEGSSEASLSSSINRLNRHVEIRGWCLFFFFFYLLDFRFHVDSRQRSVANKNGKTTGVALKAAERRRFKVVKKKMSTTKKSCGFVGGLRSVGLKKIVLSYLVRRWRTLLGPFNGTAFEKRAKTAGRQGCGR